MSALIFEHLRQCCERNESLEPLLAQWAFDKRLAAKTLQNVGKLFPHYSRHDESHSIQILTNIERVLGAERISLLSATDAWLLLEAAYHHDIGMVVSHEQLREDWSGEEFKRFLTQAHGHAWGEERSFLSAILKNPMHFDAYAQDQHPLVAMNMLGHLLADFYRRKHADRAENIVNSPVETIGLNSPRNELIPKRLFGLLGEICKIHGKGHSDLMNLSYACSGMGRDLAHPRFIACMLRLGDLLDLDDNRFCPVMLKVAGDVPASTHAHIDKHHAIRHFRVDRERIEVHAVCSTYEGYVETENWFDYLREEVAWQMAHWADIVPHEEFGLLPTVGLIETELSGYELIDNRQRPHFQLDQPKVLELLQGAGLYKSSEDALRELIQNAIDATLIHIWLKHGKGEGNDEPDEHLITATDSPFDKHVLELFERYPIRITMEAAPKSEGHSQDVTLITISDYGTGISRDDLSSMCNIGGSYRNTWKRAVIERMPIWMRPSGAFGIGIQSGFLLSDEINYVTKSVLTNELLSLRFSNPTGKERGAIYIKKEKNSPIAKRAGTSVRLAMRGDITMHRRYSRFVGMYSDPFTDRKLNDLSPILENIPFPAFLNGVRASQEISEFDWRYQSSLGIAVAFTVDGQAERSYNVFFKGQHIAPGYGFQGMPGQIYVNIFGPAEEILNVSRDGLRDRNFFNKVNAAVVSTLTTLYAEAKSEKDRAVISANLLRLNSPKGTEYLNLRWIKRNVLGGQSFEWVDGDNSNFPTIGSLFEEGIDFYHSFGDFSARYWLRASGKSPVYDDNIGLLVAVARNSGLQGHFKEVNKSGVKIGLGKNQEPWSIDLLASLFESQLANDNLRLAVPVAERFMALSSIKWVPLLSEKNRATELIGRDYMYSPFIFEGKKVAMTNFEKLVDWTFENRFHKSYSKEDVRQAYVDFASMIDGALKGSEKWGDAKRYELPVSI